ncbi:transglycosylase domain-containing protein [Glycomyces tritici]|uniref:Transglycosylase domain-containing protein n=1 Tax=Glycomyces tritici TaxID=2665176 RepID=A0ABT7YJR5_9ACTN|nr:transglycosylase domain-containing protein [Glycomyces tritici]MDN3238684.1 transglycosylase domain-containing protein [Glycomyces tritici]
MGRASVVSAAKPKAVTGPAKRGRKKKRMSKRRRRVYAALIMACLMVLGSITVAGAWFFNDVPTPEDLKFGESTTFTLAGSDTPIAGYGEFTRKLVDDYSQLPDEVTWSLLALEDKDYFEHEGVDYKGTLRALVNNLKGGDTQGASTISQQYAGMVSDIRGDISYSRKANEAVMAMKLEQEHSKEEILLHYLNLNFYGRGAYGIEAAAEVWFNKKVEDLTWGEGMMLVMQVKAGDGSFDPRIAEEGSTAPADRWTHGMNTLLTMGDKLNDDEQMAEIQAQLEAGMPATLEALQNPGTWGHDTPTGFITNPTDGYIWAELESRYGLTQADFYGKKAETGGYTVELTLDPDIQAEAQSTASRGDLKRQKNEEGEFVDDNDVVVEERAAAAEYVNEDDYFEFENNNDEAALKDYNASMASAVVAVEPGTGRVLGYYGGENGLGIDKAGLENPHPPSSTFKMITAATAIKNNASVDSWWNAESPREFDSLEDFEDNTIANSGSNTNGADHMTLTEAVRQSKNTPMYAIAEKWGANAILQTAIDMGVRQLTQTLDGKEVTYRFYRAEDGTITFSRHGIIEKEDGSFVTDDNGNIDIDASLDGYESDGVTPVRTELNLEAMNDPFFYHISFGQYPTSVAYMASVYATIAADGVYNEMHYVEAVYDRDGNPVPEKRSLESYAALDTSIARNLQEVGSTITGEGEEIDGDRPLTGKTGTWQAGDQYGDGANAHTWYVGAIPQLSIAAWVGNATAESAPLLNKSGGYDGTFGSKLSYPVWIKFMNGAIESEGYETKAWSEASHVGSPIVDDILNAEGKIDASSPYCALNAGDSKCVQAAPPPGETCDPMSEYLGLCEPGDTNGGGNGGNNGGGGGGNGGGRGDDD